MGGSLKVRASDTLQPKLAIIGTLATFVMHGGPSGPDCRQIINRLMNAPRSMSNKAAVFIVLVKPLHNMRIFIIYLVIYFDKGTLSMM